MLFLNFRIMLDVIPKLQNVTIENPVILNHTDVLFNSPDNILLNNTVTVLNNGTNLDQGKVYYQFLSQKKNSERKKERDKKLDLKSKKLTITKNIYFFKIHMLIVYGESVQEPEYHENYLTHLIGQYIQLYSYNNIIVCLNKKKNK